MSLTTKHSGEDWGKQQIEVLKDLIKKNTPTRVIGIKIGRTPAAICKKSSELNISLKPVNQPPYNRIKK